MERGRMRQPGVAQGNSGRIGGMRWGEHRIATNRRRVLDVDTFTRWRRRTAMASPRSRMMWINISLVLITLASVIGYYRASQPIRQGRPSPSTVRTGHLAST